MDGFLKQKMLKVPDFADWSAALEDDCRQQCSKNCSCIAYAYDAGIRCLSWTRSFIDTQQLSSNGVDLYIRVAYSELGELFSFPSKFNLLQIMHCSLSFFHFFFQLYIYIYIYFFFSIIKKGIGEDG